MLYLTIEYKKKANTTAPPSPPSHHTPLATDLRCQQPSTSPPYHPWCLTQSITTLIRVIGDIPLPPCSMSPKSSLISKAPGSVTALVCALGSVHGLPDLPRTVNPPLQYLPISYRALFGDSRSVATSVLAAPPESCLLWILCTARGSPNAIDPRLLEALALVRAHGIAFPVFQQTLFTLMLVSSDQTQTRGGGGIGSDIPPP